MILILALPSSGYPGQWRVVPVLIHLDRQEKSSVVTILNEGEETINLQVKAMEWTQDQDGKDVYQETKDLIFFPRILMLKKGDQKIIRTGIRVAPASKEKTYRLFIEEIPQPKTDASGGSKLTVAIRFGVAVFVKPGKEEPAADLTSAVLEKGVLNAAVKNTGNIHFRIAEITIKGRNNKGEETFSEKLNGWYLLSGVARLYSIPIQSDKCAASALMDVTISTDTKIKLNRQLNVDKSRCRH
jgi:fimbrial chaperone protein